MAKYDEKFDQVKFDKLSVEPPKDNGKTSFSTINWKKAQNTAIEMIQKDKKLLNSIISK